MESKRALFNVMVLLSLALSAYSARQDDDESFKCVYALYIRTGRERNAGTDDLIGVELRDNEGQRVVIDNVVRWGARDTYYNYFKPGSLDVFTGTGRCLSGPVCSLTVRANRSGRNPDWKCESIEVTSTGPGMQCAKKKFRVDTWFTDTERSVTVGDCYYYDQEHSTHVSSS